METFSEIRNHMLSLYELQIDEPFIISFEYPIDDSSRRQSMLVSSPSSPVCRLTRTG